jgi:hypothetical protein
MRTEEPYSQNFIFYATYESAQQARPLHNNKLERLASDKSSNLFGSFVSYEENEVMRTGWPDDLEKIAQFFKK